MDLYRSHPYLQFHVHSKLNYLFKVTVLNAILSLSTLASMKWLWFIIGTDTSAFSACPSEARCPAAKADVLTPSLYVFTAENFLEGNKHDVTTDRRYLRTLGFCCFKVCVYLFLSTVSPGVSVFRHSKYLFLPLQTMTKAQIIMQMRAMQTPTVIPVMDFWSRW